jgi:hypothetical protein
MSQMQELAKFSDWDEIDPEKVEELSDHQYMLLASHMYAFILQDRDYGKYLSKVSKHGKKLTQC